MLIATSPLFTWLVANHSINPCVVSLPILNRDGLTHKSCLILPMHQNQRQIMKGLTMEIIITLAFFFLYFQGTLTGKRQRGLPPSLFSLSPNIKFSIKRYLVASKSPMKATYTFLQLFSPRSKFLLSPTYTYIHNIYHRKLVHYRQLANNLGDFPPLGWFILSFNSSIDPCFPFSSFSSS